MNDPWLESRDRGYGTFASTDGTAESRCPVHPASKERRADDHGCPYDGCTGYYEGDDCTCSSSMLSLDADDLARVVQWRPMLLHQFGAHRRDHNVGPLRPWLKLRLPRAYEENCSASLKHFEDLHERTAVLHSQVTGRIQAVRATLLDPCTDFGTLHAGAAENQIEAMLEMAETLIDMVPRVIAQRLVQHVEEVVPGTFEGFVERRWRRQVVKTKGDGRLPDAPEPAYRPGDTCVLCMEAPATVYLHTPDVKSACLHRERSCTCTKPSMCEPCAAKHYWHSSDRLDKSFAPCPMCRGEWCPMDVVVAPTETHWAAAFIEVREAEVETNRQRAGRAGFRVFDALRPDDEGSRMVLLEAASARRNLWPEFQRVAATQTPDEQQEESTETVQDALRGLQALEPELFRGLSGEETHVDTEPLQRLGIDPRELIALERVAEGAAEMANEVLSGHRTPRGLRLMTAAITAVTGEMVNDRRVREHLAYIIRSVQMMRSAERGGAEGVTNEPRISRDPVASSGISLMLGVTRQAMDAGRDMEPPEGPPEEDWGLVTEVLSRLPPGTTFSPDRVEEIVGRVRARRFDEVVQQIVSRAPRQQAPTQTVAEAMEAELQMQEEQEEQQEQEERQQEEHQEQEEQQQHEEDSDAELPEVIRAERRRARANELPPPDEPLRRVASGLERLRAGMIRELLNGWTTVEQAAGLIFDEDNADLLRAVLQCSDRYLNAYGRTGGGVPFVLAERNGATLPRGLQAHVQIELLAYLRDGLQTFLRHWREAEAEGLAAESENAPSEPASQSENAASEIASVTAPEPDSEIEIGGQIARLVNELRADERAPLFEAMVHGPPDQMSMNERGQVRFPATPSNLARIRRYVLQIREARTAPPAPGRRFARVEQPMLLHELAGALEPELFRGLSGGETRVDTEEARRSGSMYQEDTPSLEELAAILEAGAEEDPTSDPDEEDTYAWLTMVD